jgi:hypothetical protein
MCVVNALIKRPRYKRGRGGVILKQVQNDLKID